ncbi:hypothetical protein V8G54_015855 [Vigna mungo]|uniref:Uncharacterized protein n=1 Tax=Vigna mungo TaxID=3915 RepID=A0AAQ3NJ85_VIGMU
MQCGRLLFLRNHLLATAKLNEMNGKIIGQKPLYVAVAQRKEERKANLQFSHMQIAHFSAGITGYHPAYFGLGTLGLVSPEAIGYGFQPHVLPQSMCGIAPNFIMPYHLERQGSPGQRMGPTTRRVTLSHSLPIPPNVPYNLMGPSEISASPLNVKTSATSSTTLALALASADWKVVVSDSFYDAHNWIS